ncbi:Sec-independent protein translocase TatB [Pseudarthrobacter sp. NamB4]|uniref:Sec-independent protein translocase TatB n=1 Tax=Pseudarthrobacter sp. NamB4 TaxID=2576837 RepID=UPI0010FCF15F|nr:Sec-independent protein translocase TatB [Pseudarthrobacter sp. NamB4]TLM75876.1 Sec-independent protein translocase TatB [Pseudarthrobacter sp. NamB4]
MFGINGPEFFLLLIIGVLVIGPQRLPEYTQKLANLVKEVRRMASGAREQIKEEVGIDIDDVDWKKYDPRQYDPRRIIKEALLDDESKPVSAGAPAAVAAVSGAAAAGAAGIAAAQRPARVVQSLPAGEAAPFDTEAT